MRKQGGRAPRSRSERTIFEQPDAQAVWTQHGLIVEQLRGRFPPAAEVLEEAAHDVLAFTAFPEDHGRRVWSNNPLERLNKEILDAVEDGGTAKDALSMNHHSTGDAMARYTTLTHTTVIEWCLAVPDLYP